MTSRTSGRPRMSIRPGVLPVSAADLMSIACSWALLHDGKLTSEPQEKLWSNYGQNADFGHKKEPPFTCFTK